MAIDPQGLVRFLKDVFEATGEFETERPSILRIGDSNLMISATGVRAATPSFLHVYVEDTDATYSRAVGAGATSIEPPQEMPYGDRRAMVRDPWGNDWQIATFRD